MRELVNHLERFISTHATVPLAACSGSKPTLAKGQPPQAAVQACRAKIETLRKEITAVQRAPLPTGIAKARLREQINALRNAGQPDIAPLFDERGGLVRWATSNLTFKVHGMTADGGGAIGLAGGDAPNVVALVAYLMGDQLMDRLDKLIDAAAQDDIALTAEQAAEKLRVLHAEILDLERQECGFIQMAAEQSVQISYRPDTNPLALLNLEVA